MLLAACGDARHAAPGSPAAETSVPASRTPAESLYFAGDYEQARRLWADSLAAATAAGDSTAEARLLMWLGLVSWRLGEYQQARTLGERSLALKRALRMDAELSRSENALGLLALSEGRLVEAGTLFEAAMRSAQAQSDTQGVSRGAGNLGLVYTQLGNFDRARAGFEQLRTAGQLLGDARAEGNALNNLGMLSVKLGDPIAALPPLQQARALYAGIGYAEGEQNALAQLATAYMELGDPQQALAMIDSALRVSRENGMRPEEASNLRLLAEFYQNVGDHSRAVATFAQAAGISSEIGLIQEVGVVHRGQARSYAALGRPLLATQRALSALRAHRKERAQSEVMDDLLMLAELLHSSGDTATAARYLAEARTVAGELDAASARADLSLTDARIALRSGDDSRVLRVLDQALPDLLRSRSRGEWEAHALRSRALARSGDLDSAIAAGRRAVSAAERVRTRITSAPLRTSYTSDRSTVYADLVILLLRAGRVSEAFETADAARGRALVEHLSAARTTLGSAVNGAAAAERETMLRRIDELTDHLRSAERARPRERGAVNASLEYVVEQLAQAEREYEEMLTRSASPNETAFLTRASAAEIQRALTDGELLVEYLQTTEALLVFTVSRDTVRQLNVRFGERDLAGRVRLARELIARPGTSRRSTEVLEGLNELLILPLQQAGVLTGRHSLIIVPHSSLSYLPFAALRSRTTRRYLVQDFTLTTLPSAAALPALRSRKDRRNPPRMARIATTLAPFPRALPATRAEVRAIREHLPRVRELVGTLASERRLREALALSTIVHVATHGVLNSRNPLFSRIELSPGDRASSSSTDDGELAVHEIIGARVNSDLVFLSGCETGSGAAWNTAFDRSEDYASLAQAFMYAGAGGVVATLWRVEDEGAAAFAESFYASLAGTRPAEALAKAQRLMLRHPSYGAPFYWAGYQLAGHDRPLLPKKSRWMPFN